MHSTNIIASFLAVGGLTMAATSPKRQTYYSLNINVHTSTSLDPDPNYEPFLIAINTLTTRNGDSGVCSASALVIDSNSASNIDINGVECRAYRDVDGTQPGNAPFHNFTPAELSTNLGTFSSILCYIVETN